MDSAALLMLQSTDEPLLQEPPNRYAYKVEHEDLQQYVEEAMASYWTPHEPDFESDRNDWENKLSDGQRRFIKYVLAFFAGVDGIVGENLALNFSNEVKLPEARAFFYFQMAMESVHAMSYAHMLQTYITDDEERENALNAIQTIPAIAKKAELMKKYMDPTKNPFVERLIGFAAVEGIFFSGAFLSIFYLKKQGLMPGLSFANALISRDEGLHCNFACALFSKCKNRPTQVRVHELIKDAVAIEEEFVREAIPIALIGMNADDMCTYVRFCADRLLTQLGYEPVWNAKNPFDFMHLISVEAKTNFFEKRVAEYNKVGAMQANNAFTEDADF